MGTVPILAIAIAMPLLLRMGHRYRYRSVEINLAIAMPPPLSLYANEALCVPNIFTKYLPNGKKLSTECRYSVRAGIVLSRTVQMKLL